MDDEVYRKMLRNLFPENDAKRVFVVNGSPGSGKTTFVKSKIRQGDIALDFDKLTAALALDDALYGDRRPQLDVALAAREAIIHEIECRRGDWKNAYVITASSSSEKVRQLCERLNAELITMNATAEECKERIRNDSRRTGFTDKYLALVDEWYSSDDSEDMSGVERAFYAKNPQLKTKAR